MATTAAIATCLILGALAVFQAMLALGAPLGRFAWGGQHEVLPPPLRIGSLATIAAYVAVGWVVLAYAGRAGDGHAALRVATWVIAGFFLLGAAGNLASRSRPERLVMAPVSVVLCALTVAVATLA